jgi:hypothetical protein
MSFFSLLQNLLHVAMGAILATVALLHPHTLPRQVEQVTPSATSSSVSSNIATTTLTPSAPPQKSEEPASQAKAPIQTSTVEPAPKPANTTPSAPPIQPLEPPATSSPSLSTDAVNAMLRESLVNILCTTASGGYFRPISGSGIIIDTSGVILTNAHVGQFFLLKDYPAKNDISCVIRTGSPARTRYKAELLYLPPAWMKDNASQIKSPEPLGNGKNDYAFLYITGTTNGESLPASFPAMTMTTDEPSKGLEVVIAAYPAQFLGGTSIQTELYASSAVTTVPQLYTFATSTVDEFSVGNTIVSQSGSSGGGVARANDGALIGIIATASEGTTTAARDLHAIALAHINRSLERFGQGSIAEFLLSGSLEQRAEDFNANVAPELTKELEDALK